LAKKCDDLATKSVILAKKYVDLVKICTIWQKLSFLQKSAYLAIKFEYLQQNMPISLHLVWPYLQVVNTTVKITKGQRYSLLGHSASGKENRFDGTGTWKKYSNHQEMAK
jgi:hypothetical protein